MDPKDFENIMRSKVYNALSNVVYETIEQNKVDMPIEEQKKYLENAFEWFIIHFYDL